MYENRVDTKAQDRAAEAHGHFVLTDSELEIVTGAMVWPIHRRPADSFDSNGQSEGRG